jgi:hypothetical protein
MRATAPMTSQSLLLRGAALGGAFGSAGPPVPGAGTPSTPRACHRAGRERQRLHV